MQIANNACIKSSRKTKETVEGRKRQLFNCGLVTDFIKYLILFSFNPFLYCCCCYFYLFVYVFYGFFYFVQFFCLNLCSLYCLHVSAKKEGGGRKDVRKGGRTMPWIFLTLLEYADFLMICFFNQINKFKKYHDSPGIGKK